LSTMPNLRIRHVYFYLVCFATLMMVITATVSLIMTTIDYLYPDPYYGPTIIDQKMRFSEMKKTNPAISQADIEKQIAEERKLQDLSMKRNRAKNLARNFSLLVVALPIYIYHWRKIQKETTENRLEV